MECVYKKRFYDIVEKCIKREGIKDLMTSLEKTDFFTAPASTKYHDAEEKGLVKHSLKVFDNMVTDYPRQLLESVAIVSLFHDVCKTNFYKKEMRNTKDENGKWIQVPFYTVDDQFPYGHGEKSVLLINDKMKLTLDEIMAIRWHMGAYEGQQAWNTVSKAFTDYPLALYLHLSDLKATYLD